MAIVKITEDGKNYWINTHTVTMVCDTYGKVGESSVFFIGEPDPVNFRIPASEMVKKLWGV